jgi:hypothetical protein
MQFVYDDCLREWRVDPQARTLPLSRAPIFAASSAMGYEHVGGTWIGRPTSIPVRPGEGEDEFVLNTSTEWLSDGLISHEEYKSVADRANTPGALQAPRDHAVLGTSGWGYSMIGSPRYQHFLLSQPFCIAMRPSVEGRLEGVNYLVRPREVREQEPRVVGASRHSSLGRSKWKPTAGPQRVWFEVLYHPYACEMISTVARGGIGALLAPGEDSELDRQALAEVDGDSTIFESFEPVPAVVLEPYPLEEFAFTRTGAYSTYNWEVFFHIPMLIADRLSKAGRYAEARKWFHYIYDPTDMSSHDPPAKFWRVKPLFDQAGAPTTIDELLEELASGSTELEDDIEDWRNDPFNPHGLARHRHIAYMRAVVLRYVENLVAWADSLFQRDTIESINEATQLYVLAVEILGEPVPEIEAPDVDSVDFATIRSRLDEFSNALVDLEELVSTTTTSSPEAGGPPVPRSILYFCIPANSRLRSLWNTIRDRLFKIRHCQDIEGQRRQLPLFEPPIDPALLVRARAAGLDLREVLDRTSAISLPVHRYAYLFAKAVELSNDVRGLGAALLAALEKRDAEDLSLLRIRHERALLDRVSALKDLQVEEAEEQLEALRAARAQTEARRVSYAGRQFISHTERAQQGHLDAAHVMSSIGEGFNLAGSLARLVPETTASAPPAVTFGGANLGDSLAAMGSYCGFIASQSTFLAQRAGTLASYERRQEDWDLQIEQAELELTQLERQILAAEIRLELARLDRSNHTVQREHAREVELLMREKFTNRQLYAWMSGQLAALHRDAFSLASAAARRAERAAQNELGLAPAAFSYVGIDLWEGERRGLLAGERLLQNLRDMDAAFHLKNKREHELTKHISLAMLRPEALIELKQTGSCRFVVPEIVYDLDFPGHYRRRIKSVSISIPSVTGPTTNVSAELTLERSWVRADSDAREYGFSLETTDHIVNVRPLQSIATSTANRDAGVFELSFRDERYLPFEGAGAISQWRLELPSSVPAFDHNTISDAILHISYTASNGPLEFTQRVRDHVGGALDQWVTEVTGDREAFSFLLSLRRQHSDRFHQLVHQPSGTTHQAAVRVGPQHLPFFVRALAARGAGTMEVETMTALLVLDRVPEDWADGGPQLSVAGATPTSLETIAGRWGGQPHAVFDVSGPIARDWTIELDRTRLPEELRDRDGELVAARIQDLLLVFTIRSPGA